MQYADGTEAKCGDLIDYDGYRSIVVANVDTGEVSPGYEEDLYQFSSAHHTGLLVTTESIGLVAIFYNNPTIILIKRFVT